MQHLVLITVDCLRADHLGCYGYRRATTPFLDALSADSWVFDQAVVAGTPTYYSFPAIMASRYPLALGRNVVGLAPGETTLASCLRDAGYRTAAFVAGNPYLTRRDHYDEGFEHFDDFMSGQDVDAVGSGGDAGGFQRRLFERVRSLTGTSRPIRALFDELLLQYWRWGSGRPREMEPLRQYPAADVVVRRALAWLERTGNDPAFVWIHLMDPHHPYYPRRDALALIGRDDLTPARALYLNARWNRENVHPARRRKYRDDVMALYDAGIRWADEAIGDVVQHFERRGQRQRLLLAVTGDHGEQFLEHGDRYHYPTNLHREVTRVPLLIHHPQASCRGGRVPGPTSLVHLAPTLLDMLGVEVPASFGGKNLWRGDACVEAADGYAVTECIYDRREPWGQTSKTDPRLLAVQDARHKLEINFASGVDRLFDLRSDPGEAAPLPDHAARRERAALLQRALGHLHQAGGRPRDATFLRMQLTAVAARLRADVQAAPRPATPPA